MSTDYRPDPAWQRDSTLLLSYCGLEDLIRNSATGMKATLGFDFQQLSAETGCAFLVAGTWLVAAIATGVLGDSRYERTKVLLTWILSAPIAALLRSQLHSAFPVGTPTFAV